MRNFKAITFLLILFLTLSGCSVNTDTFRIIEPPTSTQESTPDVGSTNTTKGDVSIHFIDVGQGDSILVQSSQGNILIDGGENNQGSVVVDYIKNNGISSLDYVVATHPHSDHMGGLDTVINQLDVKNVLMPQVTHTTKTFEDFITAIKNKGIKPIIAKAPNTFNVGDVKFTILNPIRENYDNLNNYSIVLRMEYVHTSFLFSGDAEALVENDILSNHYDVSSQVYKVAHHGSTTSNTEAFLDAISPKIAVISVGKDNDYGHPHKEVLKLLEKK